QSAIILLVGSAGASAVMRYCPLGRVAGVRECFVPGQRRELHAHSASGIPADICPGSRRTAAACLRSRTPACWLPHPDDRAELASQFAVPASRRRQRESSGIVRALAPSPRPAALLRSWRPGENGSV